MEKDESSVPEQTGTADAGRGHTCEGTRLVKGGDALQTPGARRYLANEVLHSPARTTRASVLP